MENPGVALVLIGLGMLLVVAAIEGLNDVTEEDKDDDTV